MKLSDLALFAAFLPCSALVLPGSAGAQETLTLSTTLSAGTNTSLATAQLIDLSDVTNGPLFTSALAAFNVLNSDTVHQNASSFTPAGQPVSPLFFPFVAPTVSLNSKLDVIGHLTAGGSSAATNYFGFAETAGAQIGLFGKATNPANEGAQLFLYDNNGNLVAIANGNGSDGLSSIIDFNVSNIGGGQWTTSITQGTAFISPFDYSLSFQMPYTALSEFTTNVKGSGQIEGGSLGAYDVNAFDGDQLHFDVHSTSPASTLTEILLFNAVGNLVAIASGNGSDGLASVIDFTVPSGDAGEWKIEVVPSQNLPTPTPYAYDLAIEGVSGLGPINPSFVPEPSTWALVVAGFAGLGFVARPRAGRETARALSASVRG